MASSAAMVLQPDFDPSMLELLKKIYENESKIRNDYDIYTYFAGAGAARGKINSSMEQLLTLMHGMERIREGFPEVVKYRLQGRPKRPFTEALQDVLAVSQNQATSEQTTYADGYLSEFFYVLLPRSSSCEVKARVAIHICEPYVQNALRVVRALVSCRDTLHSFKVAAPAGASRSDQIIAYLCSVRDLEQVQKYLDLWRTADCIGGSIPPTMQRVRPGMGLAEEPPNVPKSYVRTEGDVTVKNPSKYDPKINSFNGSPQNNQRMSFGEFHAHRIWAGLVQWRGKYSGTSNQAMRFHHFLYEVYLAYARKRVDLKKPYEFPERKSMEGKWLESYALENQT